jgi:EAL domain-containing protein (putative c-di-GMP-specific phosphodiesterase class I)
MATATGPATASPRILVVDDNTALLEMLVELLSSKGYEVRPAPSGTAALAELKEREFDLVLTDIQMPDATGVDVLRSVRQRDLDTPVILMTGNPTVESAVQALELGALRYLVKPFREPDMLGVVQQALGWSRLARLRREALAAVGADHLVADRAGLESVYQRAVAELWMAYQPVVWARDGALFGHEALLRTRAHDVGGPNAILEAAERLGRIRELGHKVRACVARDIAGSSQGAWLVNLHPLELTDPELGSSQDPLRPSAPQVCFEITERASLEGVRGLREITAGLRRHGFRIAVDDLGAGYAALSTFANLEPDLVKLDISLVRGVEASATRRKLVGSMAALCHDLGILVLAEGIETEVERQALVGLGCDLLQGYLIGRPGPLQG